jgi:hypothetical protein
LTPQTLGSRLNAFKARSRQRFSRTSMCCRSACVHFERRLAYLVTTVVSCSGETLRVLVGEHRSVGLHDSKRGQVLDRQLRSRSRICQLTSEAMSSKPENCLQVSFSIREWTSGSASLSEVYNSAFYIESASTFPRRDIMTHKVGGNGNRGRHSDRLIDDCCSTVKRGRESSG